MSREKLTDKELEAKERVCLALDNIDSVSEAIELIEEVGPYVGSVKIGKELSIIAGNEGENIIQRVRGRGVDSFLDLKFHDTPNTVYRASMASAVPGVRMFNLHVAGGKEMCEKAMEGAYEGAQKLGINRPKVIGVTVLTSLDDNDLVALGGSLGIDYHIRKRAGLAKQWGLDGIVCPASKAGEMEKEFGSDFMYVTPGVKWGGLQGKGQKQLYTPDKAVRDCSSSTLVIGSAITGSDDRAGTAYDILSAMAAEL